MVIRLGLFLSSYSFLFLILAARFETAELRIACLALAVAGFLAMATILATERAKGSASFEVATVEDQGPEVIAYLGTYLLPYLTLAEPPIEDLVAYSLFLIVLALVYVQSDMLQINPLFYLFRRRVLKITTATAWSAYLISHTAPLKGESILATTLANGILVRARDQRR